MSKGTAFASKIKKVLTKLSAAEGPVYLRTTATTGTVGALIHKYSTVANTDTLVDPTPAVRELALVEIEAASGASLLQLGDKVFIFSSDTTRASLNTSQIVYLSHVYRIIRVQPFVIFNTVVGHEVIARDVKSA